MRWDEFLDKENGTTNALRVPSLSDDQRNQLAELRHEAECWIELLCPICDRVTEAEIEIDPGAEFWCCGRRLTGNDKVEEDEMRTVTLALRRDSQNPGHTKVSVFSGRNEGARAHSGTLTFRTDELAELAGVGCFDAKTGQLKLEFEILPALDRDDEVGR